MSRRLRRTKIVTTLGPATDRDNNLEKVIAAGANVGTYELFSRLA
ncbi:pyruvate kinase [Escherichia coli]|uniref:Pyruvate kinase n=1 Tax=Escherichia coli TaxID=562 RepID=A0A376VJ61_ECOLX|nr:pyruvate kinase [Escherichia coli]